MSHGSQKDNPSLWRILKIRGFRNFISKIKGSDPYLVLEFGQAWNNEIMVIYNMEIQVFGGFNSARKWNGYEGIK
ncbi:hypothetical protein KI387_044554, partial [Taxus chinensis]